MNYKIFAIKDTLVGFLQPHIQPNKTVAIREFKNLVNSSGSSINVNYRDMDLYCLGDYNADTGEIISNVEFVIHAVDVKEVKADE